MTYLLVNADDFGYTRDVNAGIVEGYKHGIVRSTTLMANGGAFHDAVRLAHENPGLDIGCHLVLIEGAGLPHSHWNMIRGTLSGTIDPYAIFRAQIEKIIAAGIRPTHLDTHKHTHLWPPVLKAVAELGEEFQIPWIRRPFDIPLEYWGSKKKRWFTRASRPTARYFDSVIRRHKCRTTTNFMGFAITGRFNLAGVVRLMNQLPEGSIEFMCHPGHCTNELRSMPTHLKESRAEELRVLTSPEIRAAISRPGIKLVNYQELCEISTAFSPES